MILLDFLALGVVGLVAWGIVAVVNYFANRKEDNKLTNARLRKELIAANKQLHGAENTLRRIANDTSGSPALEASITLDEITKYNETKELN